jgi:hypothetical protein
MTETAEEFIARQSLKWYEERKRDRRGTLIKTKLVGNRGRQYWRRNAWTFRAQSNYGAKVFTVERLVLVDEEGQHAHPDGARRGDLEYRTGYWTVLQSGPRKGLFGWGQYCPMIPAADLEPLFEQARIEQTIV